MRKSNRFCILMGVMFPNFLPNNVPLELRSEVKIGVNHVRKTGECAPEAGNSTCKSPVLEGVWCVEGPENQQHDWRETEVADTWDPESFRSC